MTLNNVDNVAYIAKGILLYIVEGGENYYKRLETKSKGLS